MSRNGAGPAGPRQSSGKTGEAGEGPSFQCSVLKGSFTSGSNWREWHLGIGKVLRAQIRILLSTALAGPGGKMEASTTSPPSMTDGSCIFMLPLRSK